MSDKEKIKRFMEIDIDRVRKLWENAPKGSARKAELEIELTVLVRVNQRIREIVD